MGLILLGLGFGVLALSGFELNAQMGLLTAITIFIAWIADVFLLPAIIIQLEVICNGRARIQLTK